MGPWSDTSGSESKAAPVVVRRPSSNYKVRFRHGVYPNAEDLATRADIKKYDYFFGGGQTWVGTGGSGMWFYFFEARTWLMLWQSISSMSLLKSPQTLELWNSAELLKVLDDRFGE